MANWCWNLGRCRDRLVGLSLVSKYKEEEEDQTDLLVHNFLERLRAVDHNPIVPPNTYLEQFAVLQCPFLKNLRGSFWKIQANPYDRIALRASDIALRTEPPPPNDQST